MRLSWVPVLRAARWVLPGWLFLLLGANLAHALDLKDAVIVCPATLSGPEKRAVALLLDEAEKRTRFRWQQSTQWPASGTSVIAVGPRTRLAQVAGPYLQDLEAGRFMDGAEGYRLCVRQGRANPAVFVLGNDARGVLFGVGRLLRALRLEPGQASLADDLELASVPKYPLRGHQLGYRPKTNSYDAWDLPTWEQYYRDLAVFGSNAVELIPPRSDDDATSPHFPRPPMEMMVEMSRLADAYGLDVWIWYPAMDPDYADAATVASALREWSEVFRRLPRVDAVFVPGGDPGHTQPKHLMPFLAKQAEGLREFHPKAQMWVSPQSFDQVWLDEFVEILRREKPAWLNGVVFGPQVRVSVAQLRALVPAQYPLRHYPDITHSRQCQYPVPDWDVAFAVTEARECINPRPLDQAAIFHATQRDTIGFLTYSEGCNDDVNKIVWSALGWDPDAKVIDILRDYSRYFIGEPYADNFAQGLLALERNWRGPLLANAGVDTTLAQFRALEATASPPRLQNWRFQQALLRAYYDAYTRHRLIYETDLEEWALGRLRTAVQDGAESAMGDAERILDTALTDRVCPEWRKRIFELGEALFQSIRMQLSVEKYHAIAVDRGACLDTVDFPLNNAPWLKDRFAKVRRLPDEPARLKALEEILQWTNPGPGGYYDDLGNPAGQPHLVRGQPFAQDPGSLASPRGGFEEDLVVDESDEKSDSARRVSWLDHAETLYDTPLQVRYTDLDPHARYALRVVYAGDSPKRKIRLIANDGIEIHPLQAKPFPYRPIEFDLPAAATASGELTLRWSGEPGLGRNGRGCQVSEIWMMKR